MKRVKLLERLKSVQAHDLYRGRDIRSITAFMDNKSPESYIENLSKASRCMPSGRAVTLSPSAIKHSIESPARRTQKPLVVGLSGARQAYVAQTPKHAWIRQVRLA